MCLLVYTAALLEDGRQMSRADASSAMNGPVAQATVRARAASREVTRLRLDRIAQDSGTRGVDVNVAASKDKALPLLLLMEFEARAMAGDPSLGAYLQEVVSMN